VRGLSGVVAERGGGEEAQETRGVAEIHVAGEDRRDEACGHWARENR
jgi:hypothetical protein